MGSISKTSKPDPVLKIPDTQQCTEKWGLSGARRVDILGEVAVSLCA